MAPSYDILDASEGSGDENVGPRPAKQRRFDDTYRKRRTILACDICRQRRTKCDGDKPACSFCKDNGSECTYRPLREPQPSKLETEISTIRERLDHIEGLLTRRPSVSTLIIPPQGTPVFQENSPGDQKLEIPVMIIQDASFMKLIGLDHNLANYLVSLERADSLSAGPAQRGRMLVLQQHLALDALNTFYQRVHIWFPILHPRFRESYLSVISGSLPASAESCLVLIVAATGFLPEIGSLHSDRLDINYANAALEMLPVVLIECTVTSVQCLTAIAVYYCCIVRPIQAYDYTLIASLKIQTLLKTQVHDEDPQAMELVRRAYWAILILESELSNQIDLPSSSIWDLDDRIPLPSSYLATWPQSTGHSPITPLSSASLKSPGTGISGSHPIPQYSSYSSATNTNSHHTNSSPGSAEIAKLGSATGPDLPNLEEIESYYLAEIAMRRMLHRCTTSTRLHPSTRISIYAPIVAAELVYQLEEWYCHLPVCLRFGRENNPESGYLCKSPLAEFLKTQYYSCKTSIYWPAAYQAIRECEAGTDVRPAVELFFQSYIQFMISIDASVKRCDPNVWILYASIFVLTLAALKAASTPCLQTSTPREMGYCLDLALQAFDGISEASPSLECLRRILKTQLRGDGD